MEDAFEFIVDEAFLDMSASFKDTVVRDLVGGLVRHKALGKGDAEAVIQAVLERERRGTTGIGNGVAVPHSKNCSQVKELVGVFGRSTTGVGYGAVDGEPVYLFFLLCAPPDHPSAQEQNLQILKRVSSIAQDETFCRFLRQARSPSEVRELLEEAARR